MENSLLYFGNKSYSKNEDFLKKFIRKYHLFNSNTNDKGVYVEVMKPIIDENETESQRMKVLFSNYQLNGNVNNKADEIKINRLMIRPSDVFITFDDYERESKGFNDITLFRAMNMKDEKFLPTLDEMKELSKMIINTPKNFFNDSSKASFDMAPISPLFSRYELLGEDLELYGKEGDFKNEEPYKLWDSKLKKYVRAETLLKKVYEQWAGEDYSEYVDKFYNQDFIAKSNELDFYKQEVSSNMNNLSMDEKKIVTAYKIAIAYFDNKFIYDNFYKKMLDAEASQRGVFETYLNKDKVVYNNPNFYSYVRQEKIEEAVDEIKMFGCERILDDMKKIANQYTNPRLQKELKQDYEDCYKLAKASELIEENIDECKIKRITYKSILGFRKMMNQLQIRALDCGMEIGDLFGSGEQKQTFVNYYHSVNNVDLIDEFKALNEEKQESGNNDIVKHSEQSLYYRIFKNVKNDINSKNAISMVQRAQFFATEEGKKFAKQKEELYTEFQKQEKQNTLNYIKYCKENNIDADSEFLGLLTGGNTPEERKEKVADLKKYMIDSGYELDENGGFTWSNVHRLFIENTDVSNEKYNMEIKSIEENERNYNSKLKELEIKEESIIKNKNFKVYVSNTEEINGNGNTGGLELDL